MKALIVDDEPLARRELRRLLAAHRSIQIVGEAGDIDEARERIVALLPAVVFLDIQMPGGTGFDLLAQLERVPRIVFTTAYDRYAVQAFNVNALDYLLKPIEPERLATAVDKLQAATPARQANEDSWLEQLFVRDGPRCWFIPLREVSVISADGNYVRLQWGKERPLLGRSLTALEGKLDPRRFTRRVERMLARLRPRRSTPIRSAFNKHHQKRLIADARWQWVQGPAPFVRLMDEHVHKGKEVLRNAVRDDAGSD
jgi:two-component system LytT family response regulator